MAAASAASCACNSCCIRSTIAVSSTMRCRRTSVSASIEFASSCCARSRSASLVAPGTAPAPLAGPALDTVSRGRSAATAGGRFGADRALGGTALRALPAPSRAPEACAPRGAPRAEVPAARAEPRAAGRGLRRGRDFARRGFRGDDRGFDRGRIHEQRVFTLERALAAGLYRDSDDRVAHRARAADDELHHGRGALDGDAPEQDLRDAVRVASCRREPEAFGRNVFSRGERDRNDDAQRGSQSRLLRDRAESDGRQRQRRERAKDARDGGGKPHPEMRSGGAGRGAGGCGVDAGGAQSHGFGSKAGRRCRAARNPSAQVVRRP